MQKNNTEGKRESKQSRIGKRFHKEVNDIKDERLRSGISKERPTTAKITNLITRHSLWKDIKKSLIKADEKEVEEFG